METPQGWESVDTVPDCGYNMPMWAQAARSLDKVFHLAIQAGCPCELRLLLLHAQAYCGKQAEMIYREAA